MPPGQTSDPRIPARDACVLRYALDKFAELVPDRVYADFDGDSQWTYRETHRRARRTAAALARLGVRRGSHVAVWLSGGPDVLQAMLAINYLGAVYVPFNTAYRGQLLAHVIENSDAEVLVTARSFLPRLSEVALASLRVAIVVDVEQVVPAGHTLNLDILGRSEFESDDPLPELERPIEPWDTQSIIYTSGTTGPSKGVLSSYMHAYANMGPTSWPCVNSSDRYLLTLPMFHIGGSFIANIMLCIGGSIAMAGDFQTDDFWAAVKRTRSTVVFLLGAMATFLIKRSPSSQDQGHGLRVVMVVPLPKDVGAFADRFGVTVHTIFNMTEISTPTFSEPNPSALGSCGKRRAGVDLRLVDANDCEVANGEVGEMIVRTEQPWAMNHGYYKNAQATARAWRNGWFHTGDAFRKDDRGNYYFVDRMKDAIRRRGENISSFEVEMEAMAFDGVWEAAAIPVPSEVGEDDVLIVVAATVGVSLNPMALFDFLVPRIAHFMLPRYIRVIDELPKTPTAKVRKHLLRDDGVVPGCWDREQFGIQVKRDGVYRDGARDDEWAKVPSE